MDMIGLDGQLHHRPVVFCCDCPDDLLQPIPYRPYQHLAAPLGTPNDVVDYQMDIVPLVLIIHSYSIPQNNTVCKDRGPFISRLKPGAFWPISVKMRDRRFADPVHASSAALYPAWRRWRCSPLPRRAEASWPSHRDCVPNTAETSVVYRPSSRPLLPESSTPPC